MRLTWNKEIFAYGMHIYSEEKTGREAGMKWGEGLGRDLLELPKCYQHTHKNCFTCPPSPQAVHRVQSKWNLFSLLLAWHSYSLAWSRRACSSLLASYTILARPHAQQAPFQVPVSWLSPQGHCLGPCYRPAKDLHFCSWGNFTEWNSPGVWNTQWSFC